MFNDGSRGIIQVTKTDVKWPAVYCTMKKENDMGNR